MDVKVTYTSGDTPITFGTNLYPDYDTTYAFTMKEESEQLQ